MVILKINTDHQTAVDLNVFQRSPRKGAFLCPNIEHDSMDYQMRMSGLNSRTVTFIFTGLLLLYAFLLWPSLSGPFVFDDFQNLQNLEILGSDVSGNLGRYLAAFIGSPGRPLATLSFLINDWAWPSEPFSFKYTNLMIHLLNGVLLFGLLRQLAKANHVLPQSPFWPVLAMAAWLFHPLQISVQMLVVQRMTLLSATFCLIGIWGYIALLQRSRTLSGAFWAMSVPGLCTLLAFLCKENGALLPVLIWVLNATLLRDLLASKVPSVRRFIQASSILPSLVVFVTIMFMATRPGAFLSRDFDMTERFLTQMHVLSDYLLHILMPRLSGSGIYFDDYPVYRSWFEPISTTLLAVGFLTSLILAIASRKRFPILSFAVLWFFAGHAMESSILDLELYFEHRNYLPLLGPVFVLSAWAFTAGTRRALGIGLFSLWLGLLVTITALQAPVWGDARLMTKLWARERPLSLRATQELAKYQYDHGQAQAAADTLMGNYYRGVEYVDLPMTTLLASCWHPEVRRPENLYLESLHAARISPYSNSVLATLLLMRQAIQDDACPQIISPDQWLALSEALLSNPRFRDVAESHIRVERAKLFIHQRNLDRTMTEFERAYSTGPTVEMTQKIAEVLLSAGLVDEAGKWLDVGLKLKQPFFDTWLYDPKDRSRQWLKTIKEAQSARSETATGGSGK